MHDDACPVGCQARESKTGAKLLCTAIREIGLQEKPGEKSSYQRNGCNERGRTRFEKRRMVQRGMKAAFIEQEMHCEANSSESGNPEKKDGSKRRKGDHHAHVLDGSDLCCLVITGVWERCMHAQPDHLPYSTVLRTLERVKYTVQLLAAVPNALRDFE